MSIISSGESLRSPEFHAKKSKEKKIRRIVIFSIVVLLIGTLLYILHLHSLLINKVEVNGAVVVRAEDIQGVTKDYLEGNYFLIIPRANALVYPRSLADVIERKIPRLKNVETTLVNPTTLEVSVDEREPTALYCSTFDKEVASNCFFLDEGGLIFAPAPSFSGLVYFIFTKENPMEEPVGRQYLSPAQFTEIESFLAELNKIGIPIMALQVGESKYELILKSSAKIFWNTEDSVDSVLSKLESFLTSEAVQKDKQFWSHIEYLDLTTPNKVFFKFN